jgi:hypothetical protein
MTTSGDVGTEIAPEVADEPGEDGRRYGFLQLSDKSGGADFTAEDEDRIREFAALTGTILNALRAARRPE